MNRRRFTQTSLMALAATGLSTFRNDQATAAPTASQDPTPPRIGYAPVGLGDISTIFMDAVSRSERSRITGVVTGHPETKGQRFAAKYNVPADSIYTYDTFNTIRDNKAIDAVYIGLPNSMHCDFTIRAAEAGKHVLCEKPMAISSAECRRMIDACRAANVKLMIAYRVHFDPAFLHLRELIRNGEIGEIQAMNGGFYGQKRDGWRLNRALAGGGSLFDLGIYPLNAMRWLLDEEPSHFTAAVSTRDKEPRFAQVEETVEWLMRFPSGVLATAGSSYGASGGAFLEIIGASGKIRVDPAFFYGAVQYNLRSEKSKANTPSPPPPAYQYHQFLAEADHFAQCVQQNQTPQTPGEEGLADMLAIESIYKAAGAPIA